MTATHSIRKIAAILLAAAWVFVTAVADSPRYIFYFIGDGMGLGHVMIADSYNRATGVEEPLLMTTFPFAGTVKTFSASSPVTDSAAGGTALATGRKTRNNMVGMAPDTTAVESIASKLMAQGYGIGVITSNSPDDATPASFYAHAESRKMYYDIDCWAATSGFDFIGGANLRGEKDKEGNLTDLHKRLADAGVKVAYGPEQLSGQETGRVMLLNSNRSLNNTLGYAIDLIAGTMTLPELTENCLSFLQRNKPEKFFMMIENGMIDWSAHANDAGTMVREMTRLNEAIKVAYDFYLAHPDETLIIVTADHDTGGAALGNNYEALHYNAKPELLALQTMSKEAFSEEVKQTLEENPGVTWTEMRNRLSQAFGFWRGIEPTEAETERMRQLFEDMKAGHAAKGQSTLYADFNAFAAEVFGLINTHAGIGWITTRHTGNMVPVFAIGVGAERFGHLQDNTQIPATILSLTGAQ